MTKIEVYLLQVKVTFMVGFDLVTLTPLGPRAVWTLNPPFGGHLGGPSLHNQNSYIHKQRLGVPNAAVLHVWRF